MSTDFTFRTGDIECTVVRYGESAGPPAYLFPDAPAGERDAGCARYLIDGTNLGLVYSSLLLRRGNRSSSSMPDPEDPVMHWATPWARPASSPTQSNT